MSYWYCHLINTQLQNSNPIFVPYSVTKLWIFVLSFLKHLLVFNSITFAWISIAYLPTLASMEHIVLVSKDLIRGFGVYNTNILDIILLVKKRKKMRTWAWMNIKRLKRIIHFYKKCEQSQFKLCLALLGSSIYARHFCWFFSSLQLFSS